MSCNSQTQGWSLIVSNCRLAIIDVRGTYMEDFPLFAENIQIKKSGGTNPVVEVEYGGRAYEFDYTTIEVYNDSGAGAVIQNFADNDAFFTFLHSARSTCHDACCGGAAAGGGSTTFIGLSDTPANYAGASTYALRVNAAGTAVEFVEPDQLGVGRLVDADGDTYIDVTEAAADTLNFFVDGINVMNLTANKLTLNGIFIDPASGIELAPQATEPATALGGNAANTLWINSADGHVYRGSVDLEALGNLGDAGDVDVTGVGAGSVLYNNGANWVVLPAGAAGQVLQMNAGMTAPEWGTAATGTTNLSLTNVLMNTLDVASSSGTNVTLPAATNATAGVMTAGDKGKMDLISVTAAADLDLFSSEVPSLRTLSGTAAGANNFALLFSGNIIPDNSNIFGALQALETYAEAHDTLVELDDVNVAGAAAGDVLYYDGTNYVNLGLGTAGQMLSVNAGATAPEWVTGGAGGANLSLNNQNANTLDVESDSGTNVTLPAATAALAGLLPAADKAKLDFVSVTQAVDLDGLEQDVADVVSLSGVAANNTDYAALFSGNIIPDNSNIFGAIQALETYAEAHDTLAELNDTVITAAAAGDVLFYDGTNYINLGIGTAGQSLQVNAGGTAPEWATPAAGVTTFAALSDTNITGAAAGDVLYFDGTDYVNLGLGTAGQMLVVNAGATAPEWVTGGAGGANLSLNNIGALTLDVESDSGTNVTLPAATNVAAGLMPAADKAKSDFVTVTQAVNLDTVESNLADLVSLSGLIAGNTNFGLAFTGNIIPDNSTIYSAIQSLETYAETHDTLAELNDTNITGAAAGDLLFFDGTDYINLGIGTAGQTLQVNGAGNAPEWGAAAGGGANLTLNNITASTLDVESDSGTNVTLPSATGALAGLMPAADKAKSDFITITQAVDLDAMELDVADLTSLSGVASNATDYGTAFTGTTIPDSATTFSALQSLETALEAISPENIDATLALGGSLTAPRVVDFSGVNTLTLGDTAAAGNSTTLQIDDNLQQLILNNAFLSVINGANIGNYGNGSITWNDGAFSTGISRSAASTASYSIVLPPAGPTVAGQILVDTDGAGTLAWQTPAGGGATNLSLNNQTATTLDVESDTGTNVTLPAATAALAGLMPAADKVKTDFISITQAVDLDNVEQDLADVISLTGIAANSTDYGTTFTGNLIPDNSTVAGALQAIETRVEALPEVSMGAGVPAVRVDNDLHFNTTDGEWYEQVTGAWVLQDRILPFDNTGSDLTSTNAEDAIKEVNNKILYLGLFANTGALPAAPAAGSIALVGTGASNVLYKWDGATWYTASTPLWFPSVAQLNTDIPAPAVGDLAFVATGVGTGFALYGCNVAGTWEKIYTAVENLTTAGDVSVSNTYGNEYTDGANGAITGVTAFNVIDSEPGGRVAIRYNNAAQPTITGATLISSSQAFVPSVDTLIVLERMFGTVWYHFIEL